MLGETVLGMVRRGKSGREEGVAMKWVERRGRSRCVCVCVRERERSVAGSAEGADIGCFFVRQKDTASRCLSSVVSGLSDRSRRLCMLGDAPIEVSVMPCLRSPSVRSFG